MLCCVVFRYSAAWRSWRGEHLKRIGEIVDEPGVADGDGADMASETEEATEASVLETCHTETAASPDYFSF